MNPTIRPGSGFSGYLKRADYLVQISVPSSFRRTVICVLSIRRFKKSSLNFSGCSKHGEIGLILYNSEGHGRKGF